MGAVERSSGVVESYLSALEKSYGQFSINQRTVSVPADQYEDEHAKEGTVDVYVKVENDDGEVLHVVDEGTARLPSTTVTVDESLEPAAKSAVASTARVDPRITELAAVTILGLHNAEDDRETLYRLAVVFEAVAERSAAAAERVWKAYDPSSQPVLI